MAKGTLVAENVRLELSLSQEEVRALHILIDNYVCGGDNPITKALFAVSDVLEKYDLYGDVERFYGSISDEGVSFADEILE